MNYLDTFYICSPLEKALSIQSDQIKADLVFIRVTIVEVLHMNKNFRQ